ncbi:zinc finger MYM-type protein 1-like [Aphis craccivora]|uniref:Zinc finger MYM-type protein 1-like n=1 Tax=Aphis craccivora TaxID=307492 RepID=A0A6G0ZI53_APHCR|nr:zinc finger MYM-type protein 1-like [Aphis craccivora]
MLDDIIRGIDECFSQETLNLIESMGKMLKPQTCDAEIKILSESFNLNTEIKLIFKYTRNRIYLRFIQH